MNKFFCAALVASCAAATAHASPFTPGDLVVYRTGAGTAALGSGATAVFLDEYSPTGVLVQSIAMPTADSGSTHALNASGSATSEGLLTLSPNGQYLSMMGYDAALGTGSISGSSSTSIPRTVGIVNASGAIDTTTALTDAANANNPRSAVTTDGINLWVAGAAGGIRFTTDGSTTSTQLTSTVTNFEEVNIVNGQLYGSSGKSSIRLATIGSGTPTTSGQTASNLSGLAMSGTTYEFYFADLSNTVPGVDTLYMTDDATGGVLKYSFASGSWTADGSIAGLSLHGLTGEVVGGNVELFATGSSGTNGSLNVYTDTTGYNAAVSGTFNTIATAAANEAFRGVAFAPVAAVPEPQTWAVLLCGFGLLMLVGRKRRARLLMAGGVALAAGCLVPARAEAQVFTPGDLVVSTYGNVGNAATNMNIADGNPTPISLLEYLPGAPVNSAPVLTYTLPTTDSGANLGIVGEYGSSSEGTIQLSGNGQYLTLAGYSATPAYAGGYQNANGGTPLAQSTDTAVPRVAALIDINGNVNTSTVFNDIYSTNNPRSVYTTTGASIYISGQGSSTADQGIYLAPVGTNTVSGSAAPVTIYNTLDTRTVQGYNGNLFYSIDKKNKVTGIYEYNGYPTGSGASVTTVLGANNGLSGASKVSYSPEGFYFANPTTLYVADTGVPKSGGTANGGIEKLSLIGGNWVLDYTLSDANFLPSSVSASGTFGETGFEAITGQILGSGTGATVNLFAVSYTAADAEQNGLYEITDSLAATSYTAEAFTEIETSGTDSTFKGVSFSPVPEPSACAMTGLGLAGLAIFAMKRKAGKALPAC